MFFKTKLTSLAEAVDKLYQLSKGTNFADEDDILRFKKTSSELCLSYDHLLTDEQWELLVSHRAKLILKGQLVLV